VVPGRTGKVYADWIAEREQPWRDAITVAALDPFRGYATAVCTHLPAATRVLDAFHVVALAVRVVDDVRRRVQQDTRGHRGLTDDPLYRVRRLLRLGAERLTEDTRAKLDAALRAGDPNLEVTIAWHCYQQLRATYHHKDPQEGRRQAQALLEQLPTARSPRSPAWAARCDRGGSSSSPTSTPAACPTGPPRRSTRWSRSCAASATASATSITTGFGYCCTAASPGTLHSRHESGTAPHAWWRRAT